MSYIHLANSLYDLRSDKLRDIAMKKYRALDVADNDTLTSITHDESVFPRLNILLDRAVNLQGDLTDLYEQGLEFGIPALTFSELGSTKVNVAAPTSLTNLQKALQKHLKQPKNPLLGQLTKFLWDGIEFRNSKGDTVFLEHLGFKHEASLASVVSDPEVMKYISVGNTWSLGDLREHIGYAKHEWDKNRKDPWAPVMAWWWAVVYNNKTVGMVGVFTRDKHSKKPSRYELRILLSRESQGKGLGKLVAQAIFEHVRITREIALLEAEVHSDDKRGAKFIESIGFVSTGRSFYVGRDRLTKVNIYEHTKTAQRSFAILTSTDSISAKARVIVDILSSYNVPSSTITSYLDVGGEAGATTEVGRIYSIDPKNVVEHELLVADTMFKLPNSKFRLVTCLIKDLLDYPSFTHLLNEIVRVMTIDGFLVVREPETEEDVQYLIGSLTRLLPSDYNTFQYLTKAAKHMLFVLTYKPAAVSVPTAAPIIAPTPAPITSPTPAPITSPTPDLTTSAPPKITKVRKPRTTLKVKTIAIEPIDVSESERPLSAKAKPDLLEVISRLKNACEGKAHNAGGYNVPHLLDLLRHPPVGKPYPIPKPISKPELLKVLCGSLIPLLDKEVDVECTRVCENS